MHDDSTDLADRDPRSFLKQMRQLLIGDMFPNVPLDDKSTVHDLITDHLIMLVVSTGCDACLPTLEALDDILNRELEGGFNLRVALIFDTEESKFAQLAAYYRDRALPFRLDGHTITHRLHTYGLPWGYSLNEVGQILISQAVPGEDAIRELIRPFVLARGLHAG